MPRYLIRPSASLASRALNFVGNRLHHEAHPAQLAALRDHRRTDPFYDDLRRWLAEMGPGMVLPLSGEDAEHNPITGTRIWHMAEEHAEQLRREIHGVEVVVDRVMELIRPSKTATLSAKESMEPGDPWHLEAIGLKDIGNASRKGGEGVTVVVLDTGVAAGHPEIAGRVKGSFTFDTESWKAEVQDPAQDTQGHGTRVTGLICGKTVGVAPEAEVIDGVMLPKGIGKMSDFIFAMEWAGQQPEVQLVNLSAGLPGYLEEMATAVSGLMAVGVLPVVAVGNEGRNRTRSPGNFVEVISVGASNDANKVASFSGGGTVTAGGHSYKVPDLVAPGAAIYSCDRDGGYDAWDGTSMATPIVSGIAALLLEQDPHITVTDLTEELMERCQDLGAPEDRQGRGLLRWEPPS